MGVKLKITKTNGEVHEFKVTPIIEYAFEAYAKKSYAKAFIEDQKQTDVYWLAWETLRRNEITVPTFGEKFLESIEGVEILATDEAPNS